MTVSSIIGVFVKIFFLLTPFFVLSVYVTLTRGEEEMSRRKLAVRTTVAVLVITMILYLFGEQIFRYLGITLDAFRIGYRVAAERHRGRARQRDSDRGAPVE